MVQTELQANSETLFGHKVCMFIHLLILNSKIHTMVNKNYFFMFYFLFIATTPK